MRLFFLLVFVLAFNFQSDAQLAATVSGEVLVQLAPSTDPKVVESDLNNSVGLLPKFKLKECVSEYMNIWLYSFDEGQISKPEIFRELRQTKGVLIAQANHIIESRLVPNDPFFGQQWHHVQSGDHDIDSDLAWDITTGGLTATGDEIVVCVVEPSGAKWDHVDLIDNHWVNEGEIANNGIDDDLNGYIDDYDGWNVANNNDNLSTGNHGTQVSSMIGAKGDNNTGIVGVNWDVKLMQVQIANITEAGVIAAYTYPLIMRKMYNQTNGEKGAFVVATNSSWGTDGGQPEDAPLWCNMYDSLGTYGVISCGSTANNNVNVDVVGDLPTACPSDFLISVTATNNNDQRTFSGYGITTIDIGAPGDQVYLAGASTYGNASGTSFASPCVAGAVGLLYSAPCTSLMQIAYGDPELAASYIIQYLYDGVDPVASLADELVTGGRLNVKNSLDLLIENCSVGGCVAPFGIDAVQVPQSLNYQISWNSVNETSTYNLRYRITGNGTWTTVNNISSMSAEIPGLSPCAQYEVQVMANCLGDESSEWSTLFTFSSEGCCVNPTTYTVQNQNDTSINLTWNDIYAADGYTLLVTEVGGSSITFENIETNNFNIPGLSPCTDYIVAVTSICVNPENPVLSFDTNTAGCGSCDDLEYCITSADASLEFIERVTLGDINRISGSDGGYIKVDDQTTTLVAGQSYTILCKPGYSGFPYSEYFKVWIDYDANGIFDPNSEIVFDAGSTTTIAISGEFTVPSNVSNGVVRMRVGMSYLTMFGGGNQPAACGDNGEGETEDYCITLQNSIGIDELSQLQTLVFPNPTNDILHIQNSVRNAQLCIVDNLGRKWMSIKMTDFKNSVDVSDLPAGVYHLNVIGEDGESGNATFVKQ